VARLAGTTRGGCHLRVHEARRPRRVAALAGLLALTGIAVACSDEGSADDAATAESAEAPSAAPDVEVPADTAPPEDLQVTRLVESDGPTVGEGDTVRVHFVAVAWSTGEVVDSTWQRAPFQFTLGQGAEIAGWAPAIDGMAVGERRRVTVPATMAYDETRVGPLAGETLVFVVDLLEIVPA
jgi:peptidylprolyl isomerase